MTAHPLSANARQTFWRLDRRVLSKVTLLGLLVMLNPILARADAALTVQALDSASAQLQWTLPPTATRVQILRNARLIDDVTGVGTTLLYTDYLLWPSATFGYTVKALDPSGAVVGQQSANVITPAQAGAFPRFYASSSFWNQPIPPNPAVDPNSSAMVARALVPYGQGASIGNSDDWGIPITYANPLSKLYQVGCTMYACNTSVSSRIPRYATPSLGADHHMVVIDSSSNAELDGWLTSYDAGTDSWSAGSRFTTQPNGWGAQCGLGQHCFGGTAAGFSAAGGLIRPEEIAQGHIDHALFFFTPATRSGMFACPATSTDGVSNDPNAMPLGSRVQLDPSFNVDGQAWPTWEKVVAHALQTYGAYLGDTGGAVAFAAEPNLARGYDAWWQAGVWILPSVGNLPWSQFRVMTVQQC